MYWLVLIKDKHWWIREHFSLVSLFDCMAQEQTVKAISLQTQMLLNHRSTGVKEDKCDLP